MRVTARRGPAAPPPPTVAARRATLRLFAAAVLSVSGAGGACGGEPSAPDGARESVRVDPPLKIGVASLRISLPVMLAERAGLFIREGLDVELEPYETAQPMMDAFAAGHLDLAGYVAFPIAILAERRSGRALRHVTVLLEDAAHPISRLVVRTGSGVASLGDLAGRRVGILPTAAYRAWLGLLLRSAGVDPGSVEMVPLAPPMTASGLASGLVDAVLTNDPAATAAIAAGAAALLVPEPALAPLVMDPLPFGSFVVAESWAVSHPAEVCAIARALDGAVALAAAEPAVARAALAAHLPASEGPLVARYPDALYRSTDTVDAGELSRLVDRYVALGVIPAGARALPLDAKGCPAPAAPARP